MSSGGASGLEAMTIGFTLIGAIAAFSLLGWWLDNHFKTGFWLPVLFLVGAVAGFREMFVVLARISKAQKIEADAKKAARQSTQTTRIESAPPAQAEMRERIFKVPSPFEKQAETTDEAPEEVDELIKRLMDDEDDETKR